jgi:hypothetical protein
MLHLGDLDCLLDLIHEVNEERRGKHPEIEAFDFYPSYQKGTLFQQDNEAIYGLTWGPEKLCVVQRGFFALVLKAFLKARAMGLVLLFSKDHALREWMAKLPFTPLAIASFLDALHRYLDLEGSTSVNDRMEALFDLLKHVHLGDPQSQGKDTTWYTEKMGMKHTYCSSCGYVYLDEFFDHVQLLREARTRFCAGCLLHELLDYERDHMKADKRYLLADFLDWPGSEHDQAKYNPRAPLYRNGLSLMHVYNGPRFDHNTLGPNDPRRSRPGLEDIKIVNDSLQNLPTLAQLMSKDQRSLRR